MRSPNDLNLAKEVDNIDLVLGGHDHHYFSHFLNGKWIIKSGTDFKGFSLIDLNCSNNNKLVVQSIERYIVDSKVKEDEELKLVIENFLSN
jgi:5'-nucleotidase